MKGMKRKIALFSRIENKDDALKIVKDSAMGFFFIAALQIGLGLFVAPSAMIDGVLYAGLAAVLLKWKSRIAAVFLLLFGGAVLVVTALNKMGITAEGGKNIILAVVVFWGSIRSVEATFKLHGKYSTVEKGKPGFDQ